jgi:transposase
MPSQDVSLDLDSRFLGALPIVNHFLRRLQIASLLEQRLGPPDPRSKMAPVSVLMILLRSLIVAKAPLYSISEWAAAMEPSALGLTAGQEAVLNDDRIGRALDELFESDRVALLTEFVLKMVREFQVRLDELHNDSTTLTFQGEYIEADGRKVDGIATHRITWGHSKDLRPDLKQLLWILTVSSDGAVPVHFKVDDGNVSDVTTHRETWDMLRRVVGGPKFLYVADCKLCAGDNMRYIDAQHGSFITVLPRSRKECDWFREWVCRHDTDWQQILVIPPSAQKEPNIIESMESPIPEVNGFRLIWFRSSEKCRRDADIRQDAIVRGIKELEKLAERLFKPRVRFTKESNVRKAVDEILERVGARRWIDYKVERTFVVTDRQEKRRSQPSAPLKIRQTKELRFKLSWQVRAGIVSDDAKSYGVLPLVTNCRELPPLDVYHVYHDNQPMVEKRHDLLKNTLQVTPSFIHNISRLEALLFLEYIAVTVHALAEREIRQKMVHDRLQQIPLYPEARECRTPTAERVFEIFEHLQLHILTKEGRKIRTFIPRLSELQKQVLGLLQIPQSSYT